MLNLENLTWDELEKLANFFKSMLKNKEADIVLDFLATSIEDAYNENQLNTLENQSVEC